jgi:uncharacterized protein involved in exopolysaccharide biosynthesis
MRLVDKNNSWEAGADPSFSLRRLVSILFKRKRIILTVWISLVATVTLGNFLLPHIYEASSTVLVERTGNAETALLFRLYLPHLEDAFDWVNSETEIIKSHPLAAHVVTALRLEEMAQTAKPAMAADSVKQLEKSIKAFQQKLSVASNKQSNVIVVSYEDKNPQLAANVVNQVVAAYTRYRAELYSNTDAYEFFSSQMRATEEKLRQLEQNQTAFKQEQEVVAVDEQRKILLARLADYESRMTTVRTRRIGKQSLLEVIKQQLKKGKTLSIPTTESSDNPSREKHIAKLRGDLLDMETQRERLLQKFTPQYEEVVNLNQQITATKAQIRNEIQQIIGMEENSLRALNAEEEELQAAIEKIKDEMRTFAQKEYELDQLSRGIDDNREVFSMLLKQREEARISLGKLEKGVKIKVISPAVAPLEPAKPRRKVNVALSGILGLLCGVGWALLVERLDHTINNPMELEQALGLPALGSIREIINTMQEG